MVIRILSLSSVSLLLSGCLASFHHAAPNGKEVDFKKPMLTKSEIKGGTYILVEKSISDGKYKTVSIGKERPKIQNERQERIVFSEDLTKYAVDFEDYSWEEYVDRGNYNQATYVARCTTPQSKTRSYSPCSTEFKYTFVPMSVTKAYVAGHMSTNQKKAWEDPNRNPLVAPLNPWKAIHESGAVYEIGIVKVEK